MTQQLRPFRQGTRLRRQYLTSFSYDGSAGQRQPTPYQLPKTGYAARLWLEAAGTIDQSGAGGSLGVDGLAGLFQSINLSANLGSASIFQASGAGADVAARWGGGSRPVSAPFSLATTSASPYSYTVPINIAMNMKRQFNMGLINLQDPEVQVLLALQFNPLTSVASLATSGGTSSITVKVWMEYFEVPNPAQYAQPPRLIARTLEELWPTATQVGDNIYQVPRLGVMTDFSAIAYANSARMTNAAMNQLDLRLNKTLYVETRNGLLQPALDADAFGPVPGVVPGAAVAYGGNTNVQPGVFGWYGWNATDVPDNGDFRDALNTEEVTTTEFILNVATGTTVVSTDQIRAVRRVLQALQ